jgi:hypothetical protein
MRLAVRKAGSKGDSKPALHIVGPKLMHVLILVDDAPLALSSAACAGDLANRRDGL